MTKSVLVTGGAGYIGSHTCHQLVEAGENVVVIDNFYSGHRWAVPKEALLVEGDAGDIELTSQLMREHNVNNFAKMPTDTQIVLRARKLGADLPMPPDDDDEDDIGELAGGTADDQVDDASGEGDDAGCQEDCEEKGPYICEESGRECAIGYAHDTFKG